MMMSRRAGRLSGGLAVAFAAAVAASTPAAARTLTCSGWQLVFSDDYSVLIRTDPPFPGAQNLQSTLIKATGTYEPDLIETTWLDSDNVKYWWQQFRIILPAGPYINATKRSYIAIYGWAEQPTRNVIPQYESGWCE
ncbi:MAG: hypothetical protein HQL40_04030 [Alphaproteobacteria bacterium]|nr:hypothetical protein [Alphaproteobacteria bacterium]